jgi:hypothetical protein
LADSTIDGLPTLASVDRATDKLAIWDASDSLTAEATINSTLGFSGGNPVSTSDSQTLTNKTLTSPTISGPTLSGTVAGTYTLGGTPTFPASVVTLAGSQTLTNKTLTSPTINSPTIANPTLTVDSISEYTAANGVNIDGLLIKDGLLPAGNIQPLNLVTGTGSSWVWQTWSPTLTNLSGGTLVYAKYVQIGKTVHCRFLYTLAGAGVAGAVMATLPVSANSQYATANFFEGSVMLRDTGTIIYPGLVAWTSATTVEFQALIANAAYLQAGGISSTVPHTWANTDQIQASFSYEAA